MRVRVIASLVMALCFAVGSASASSISVYFAADASDCDTSVPAAFSPVNAWILADLYGDVAVNGITGAEFRVDGWPATWFGAPVRNPLANIDVGNPLTGGTNIAFPVCQPSGVNGTVLLFTINGLATTVPVNMVLKTERHTTPSNPNFPCPLVTICDAVFTAVCVSGGEAFINGPPCNVAVAPATWSTVKSMYGH